MARRQAGRGREDGRRHDDAAAPRACAHRGIFRRAAVVSVGHADLRAGHAHRRGSVVVAAAREEGSSAMSTSITAGSFDQTRRRDGTRRAARDATSATSIVTLGWDERRGTMSMYWFILTEAML